MMREICPGPPAPVGKDKIDRALGRKAKIHDRTNRRASRLIREKPKSHTGKCSWRSRPAFQRKATSRLIDPRQASPPTGKNIIRYRALEFRDFVDADFIAALTAHQNRFIPQLRLRNVSDIDRKSTRLNSSYE